MSNTDVVKMLQLVKRVKVSTGSYQRRLELSEADVQSLSGLFDYVLSTLKDQRFNVYTAALMCQCGCFMTNEHFGAEESMHYYNGKYYYEDGAVVSESYMETLNKEFGDTWYIKYTPDKVDVKKLSGVHRANDGYVLVTGSYENCVMS